MKRTTETTAVTATPASKLISRRQLAARWGCCVESIKRRQRAGLLHPIYLSSRMLRYSLQNVEEIEADAS